MGRAEKTNICKQWIWLAAVEGQNLEISVWGKYNLISVIGKALAITDYAFMR